MAACDPTCCWPARSIGIAASEPWCLVSNLDPSLDLV
jgi:hypothetical protein